MKIQQTKGSGSKINLLLQPSPDELEKLKTHVLSHFSSSVKVPGFREGTAPLPIVEKNIDQQALTDEFLNHAVNEFYQKAVEVEKLRPVGQPKITIKKFVPYNVLEIEAEFDSLGPIILPDYKKLKVPKKAVNVTPKDIDEVLNTLSQRLAEHKTVDRPAKIGDEVIIDFDGYDKKGGSLPGASAKNHSLILGSGAFIPGFEKGLVGTMAGDEKELKLKFPAEYHMAALANQNVDFKVKVHKVNEVIKAKIDESLAAKAGPFKTIAELKTDIKKQLTAERLAQAAREHENQIVLKISEKSKLDVPAGLVEEEVSRMEDEEKRDLTFRGQTWEEHLKAEGLTEEQHREKQKPLAAERVKGGLVLSEIAEREKIKATDEEVQQRIELLRSEYKDEQMRAELDNPDNRNQIVSRILTEKTLANLVKYASKS